MPKNALTGFRGAARLVLSIAIFVVSIGSVSWAASHGHHPEIAEPFKIGTFEIDGENRVGIVL